MVRGRGMVFAGFTRAEVRRAVAGAVLAAVGVHLAKWLIVGVCVLWARGGA